MKFNSLSKTEQKEIVEVLSNFGLNEKERAIYFSLLARGRSTISPIATELNYPLTTVQSIAERLSGKGLVSVGKNKTRHYYEANDPVELKSILEQQIKEVSGIIPMLKKIKGNEMTDSKVKVYYRERVSSIFQEALKAKNKMIYEIVSAEDFQQVIGEKFHFSKRRIENNVRLKSLRVEAKEIKKYSKRIHERELREAKFLPAEMNFRGSIMIWDNTVAIFSTKNEGVAVTIESAVISEMLKQMFEILWSFGRRMETLAEIL
ncbi:MAG: helix-turn-helix domain-containing protein [Candidatus Magasanikbacteria bacterium]|nr:helix-turn-helix domain-containing protein [Candidatus Magasanikbacteria bacterium]